MFSNRFISSFHAILSFRTLRRFNGISVLATSSGPVLPKTYVNGSKTAILSKFRLMYYYYHFVGHCGAFCGLKWRIWRAKMYFSPLK